MLSNIEHFEESDTSECMLTVLVFSPKSDMDYMTFNMHIYMIFLHVSTHMGKIGLWSHLKDFCRLHTEFDSGEITGWAQSLASNGQPSMW